MVFGGAVLFLFAMGMCALIILVGTFSGVLASLPKSGGWMEWVKKIFGVAMIFVGEYFIFQAGVYW